jgi:hypothetical protein
MSPEERHQIAFEVFDECLAKGMDIELALRRAAEEGGLKVDVFRAFAEHQLSDLGEYARKVQLRSLNAAIAAEVKFAASKRHPENAFADCFELEEVAAKVEARIGRRITETEVSRIEEAYRDFVIARVKRTVEELRSHA